MDDFPSPAPTLTPSLTRNEVNHLGYVLALSTLPHKALPLQGWGDIAEDVGRSLIPGVSASEKRASRALCSFLRTEESREVGLAVSPTSHLREGTRDLHCDPSCLQLAGWLSLGLAGCVVLGFPALLWLGQTQLTVPYSLRLGLGLQVCDVVV